MRRLAACRSLSRALAYEMLSIFFKRLLGPQVATVAVLNHDLSTILTAAQQQQQRQRGKSYEIFLDKNRDKKFGKTLQTF